MHSDVRSDCLKRKYKHAREEEPLNGPLSNVSRGLVSVIW